MPKAILAIRSYPLTVLLAALVFALTLVLTTTSIGKVGIGGDDEGSGFGGTGRAGESGGSGFGGTGSPSPFFGVTEEDEGEKARQELDRIREELRPVDLPEALQRSIENNLMRESAHIAEAFKAPVVEAPLVAPAQDRVDTERLSRSGAMPAMQIARPTMQLSVPVVMPEPANIIESFQLPSAEPEIAQLEIAEKSSPVLPEQIGVLDILELSKELKINSEVESIKEGRIQP